MTVDLRTLDLDESPKTVDFEGRYPLLFNIARLFLTSLGPEFENLPTVLEFEDFKDVKEDEVVVCDDLFSGAPLVGVGLILRDSVEPLLLKLKEDYDRLEQAEEKESCDQLLTRVRRLKDLFDSLREFAFSVCYVRFPNIDSEIENSGIAYRKYGENVVLVAMPATEVDKARNILLKAALKKTRVEGPQDAMALLKTLFGGDD